MPERSRIRSVFHVTREYAGLGEAGGVKDAVSGLAGALTRMGVRTTVALPLYGFLKARFSLGRAAAVFAFPIPDHDRGNRVRDERVRVLSLERDGVRFLLVDSGRFSDKNDVYTYTDTDEIKNSYKKKGTGHWDSHQMNVILQKAALEIALRTGDIPDIFHCHDGHAAFLPALMREDRRISEAFARTGAVVTIHNAGVGYHQEIWDPAFAALLTGLSTGVLSRGMLNATVDPLLLAGSYARMTTVSEQYADELLGEKEGEVSGGLGRTFSERGIKVTGITNGVDPVPFDPRFPAASGLPFRFDPSTGDLDGKKRCKKTLLEELSVTHRSGERPLFGFIGRLTTQKGIDVLGEAVTSALGKGRAADFIVLGQGESKNEELFRALSSREFSQGSLCFVSRYDPGLAKRLNAASDFLLIPSKFEPCGLTDFHAQLMGSIPVVHAVGGLRKVRDAETGLSYDEQSSAALEGAIDRCLSLYVSEPEALSRIRKTAFDEIFQKHTWDMVAREGYLPLYEDAAGTER
jgi:starch synthase